MQRDIATNAISSGVKLDKHTLKSVAAKSDKPGLVYLAQWFFGLALTSGLVWATLETVWVWPAMFVHGVLLTVPAYSFSHECAHATAFKSKRLNEAVFWFSSLIYMEEPVHRRFTHTSHHTFTWHEGRDAQMPFDTPMGIGGWLAEISGLALLRFHAHVLFALALGRYTDVMHKAVPKRMFKQMTRNARIMLVVYAAIALAPFAGVWWPLWLLVIPRMLGAPVMLLFTLLQHVELQENSPSIIESTRSFRSNWLGRFLYMNMNNHVEHHLYPQVPFHALPQLADALADQVPAPDPGFFRGNWEVFVVTLRRSLGYSTKAPSIRQAPHMITDGGPIESITKRSM
ncbi:MAG: fatty acid desaturase [Pseudomonadota bacterium]